MLNPWVLIVLLVTFVANGFYWNAHGTNTEEARLTAKYNQEKVVMLNEIREREKQKEIQVNEIISRQTKEIENIQRNLDAALISLRKRPTRSTTLPESNTCQGTTGRELSREDAEFLTREAARADQIRAGLAACYEY